MLLTAAGHKSCWRSPQLTSVLLENTEKGGLKSLHVIMHVGLAVKAVADAGIEASTDIRTGVDCMCLQALWASHSPGYVSVNPQRHMKMWRQLEIATV